MTLYLARHATAFSASEDPKRRLSPEGLVEAERVALFLKSRIVVPRTIYHSPKMRAHQTARIFATILGVEELVESAKLLPSDSADYWHELLQHEEADTMLVGHLPHIEELALSLLGVRQGGGRIGFSPASVLCLEKVESSFLLRWFIEPSIL